MIKSNVPIPADGLDAAKDIIAALSLVKNEVIDPNTGAVLQRGTKSILPESYDMAGKEVDVKKLTEITDKDKQETLDMANAYFKEVLGQDITVGKKIINEDDLQVKVGKRVDEDDYMAKMVAATMKTSKYLKS